MTRSLLSVLVLLVAAAPAAADDAWCDTHPGEVLVRDADGIWHRIADDLPRDDDEGRLAQAWRGDLDADGRTDLVLRDTGGCGTRECPFEAFVSCPDGTFSRVMEPAYADRVKVTPRKRGWARLRLRTVGERGAKPRYLWATYRFGGDGYRWRAR